MLLACCLIAAFDFDRFTQLSQVLLESGFMHHNPLPSFKLSVNLSNRFTLIILTADSNYLHNVPHDVKMKTKTISRKILA